MLFFVIKKNGKTCHVPRKCQEYPYTCPLYYEFHCCSDLSSKILQCLPLCACGFILGNFQAVPHAVCFSFTLKEATRWKVFTYSNRQKERYFSSFQYCHHCCLFQWSVLQCLPFVWKCLCASKWEHLGVEERLDIQLFVCCIRTCAPPSSCPHKGKLFSTQITVGSQMKQNVVLYHKVPRSFIFAMNSSNYNFLS